LNGNERIRQIHRGPAIAFTVTVIICFVAPTRPAQQMET